jgi:Co/Zn/Cd efflux system component
MVLRSVNVMLGGVPEHIDLYDLCTEIEDLPGVMLIDDFHVFKVTSNFDLMTEHIHVDPAYQGYEDKCSANCAGLSWEGADCTT